LNGRASSRFCIITVRVENRRLIRGIANFYTVHKERYGA